MKKFKEANTTYQIICKIDDKIDSKKFIESNPGAKWKNGILISEDNKRNFEKAYIEFVKSHFTEDMFM